MLLSTMIDVVHIKTNILKWRYILYKHLRINDNIKACRFRHRDRCCFVFREMSTRLRLM